MSDDNGNGNESPPGVAVIGELLPRGDRKHEFEFRRQRLLRGVATMLVMAEDLREVKRRKLYLEGGFASFAEFCARELQMDPATASRLLGVVPVLVELKKLEISNSQDALRPVHFRAVENLMPRSAARTLASALSRAPLDRYGKPRITRKLVEDTARAEVRIGGEPWKPHREWLAEKRAEKRGESSQRGTKHRDSPQLTALLALLGQVAAVDWVAAVREHGALLDGAEAYKKARAAIWYLADGA